MDLDYLSSMIVSRVRGGAGSRVLTASRTPAKPLELYEFEACPFCRKVREALSALDLDAIVYPCPKRGQRYRPQLKSLGGKFQFPFLVDPNTGRSLYESNDIIRYLNQTYAATDCSQKLLPTATTMPTMALASLARPLRGALARASREPAQPLTLFSYENSPHCRLVRERLCELELRYQLRTVAAGSAKRAELIARAGREEVPYLIDPNTQREVVQSAAILSYLDATYAL
jgi:glutathione S-transferase